MALTGKVAVITGGSAGLGASIAQRFCREGARVCISGRRQEQLENVAKKCQEVSNAEVLAVSGDVTKKADRQKLVDSVIQKFGRTDILINNAGIAIFAPMAQEKQEDYDLQMDVNLRSPIFLTQLFIPHLVAAKGSIINMSSLFSIVNVDNTGVYSISKAALDVYTKVLARELGPQGVRVNSVNPSLVPETSILKPSGPDEVDPTEQVAENIKKSVPLGRNGRSEDVDNAVVFLASEQSSFITGQLLCVEGGLLTQAGFSL